MSGQPLFVTRKFPPSVGGMETLAAGVWRVVSQEWPTAALIANGGSNRRLPWWVPLALVRTVWLVVTRRAGFVLTGDALLYALVSPVLHLLRVPHATMVMGLDVTYDNRVYRAVVHTALRRAPSVIAISEATAQAAREFGVPAARTHVVRLGVPAPTVTVEDRAARRADLGRAAGVPADAVVLATLGRLVRRKGARWFVEEVLPELRESVHYVVAGSGPESEAVAAAARTAGVEARVHLLGAVDDDLREAVLQGADIFVQPNIRVAGDMEGFGLVTIEAALRGTPVVAAALEGILDAVVDGSTGALVPAEDADAWAERLRGLTSDRAALVALGQTFRANAQARYGQQAMHDALVALIRFEAPPPSAA